MTKRQMQWAAQHDWFIGSFKTKGAWFVVTRDDLEADKEITFTDFVKLRDWAGY